MAEHFPPNQTLPDYVLIGSDHDMANTREGAAPRAAIDGADQVRSITQPTGTSLKPASIANQLGKLAQGLRKADRKLEAGAPGAERLRRPETSAAPSTSPAPARPKTAPGSSATAPAASPTASARPSDRTNQAASGARRLR